MENPLPRRRPLVAEGGTPALTIDLKAFKPIPDAGIARAVEVMRQGRAFRYGPKRPEDSEVSRLEREFATYLGRRYAVAVNSCGSAMFLSLKIAGVEPGDRVLMNAFTFTAVPSAVHHAGARPLLVESARNFAIDPADLDRKAAAGDARVLLLSYMRGHVPNMDEVLDVVGRHDLLLVEDCAHAYNTLWDGAQMGTFGHIAAFSTQSSKGLSAGEGGLLATDDPEVAAKAILYSGSYERHWKKHFDAPDLLTDLETRVPGYSLRMTEVAGAMIRPQIPRLDELARVHAHNHARLSAWLEPSPYIDIPARDPRVTLFGDTLQFHLVGLTRAEADAFLDLAAQEGIPMQIFGSDRNARDFRWWKYLDDPPALPLTASTIDFAVDLVLGAHLTEDHIDAIADAFLRILDYLEERR